METNVTITNQPHNEAKLPVVRSCHNLQYVPFSRHSQYGSTYECKKCGREFQERYGFGKWRDLHNGEMPELGECQA